MVPQANSAIFVSEDMKSELTKMYAVGLSNNFSNRKIIDTNLQGVIFCIKKEFQ